jgi:hypothetical protein
MAAFGELNVEIADIYVTPSSAGLGTSTCKYLQFLI